MKIIPRSMMYRRFMEALSRLHYGELTLHTPDGAVHQIKGKEPGYKAHAVIHEWTVVDALLSRGDIGMGETYIEGLWDSDDLETLIKLLTQNLDYVEHYAHGNVLNRMMFFVANYWLRRNSKRGSKSNIRKHYDVGNDFYKLWLDESMTYSSALYQQQKLSLESAQQAKYGRILGKLEKSHENILEVGCGWGGFAEAAVNKGHGLTGITISPSQFEIAKQRTNGKANIKMQDYRDTKGQFDAIVSIEMFEAVGERYWPTYFKMLKSNLKEGGKAVVQTITIRDDMFKEYRVRSDFIRTYTFPGGMLPSIQVFREEAMKAGLACREMFCFGKDYARTLSEWLKRFDKQQPEIRKLGYDETFIRNWRFYLALCIGGFDAARTDVMQVEMEHA